MLGGGNIIPIADIQLSFRIIPEPKNALNNIQNNTPGPAPHQALNKTTGPGRASKMHKAGRLRRHLKPASKQFPHLYVPAAAVQ